MPLGLEYCSCRYKGDIGWLSRQKFCFLFKGCYFKETTSPEILPVIAVICIAFTLSLLQVYYAIAYSAYCLPFTAASVSAIYSTMRLPQIDFLRCIAVMLVLVRHQGYIGFLQPGGWVGVDLFFVLSGFLVSGLLFREFKTSGKVRPLNFLVRRGFKIYPLYYFFMLVYLFQAFVRQYMAHEPGFHFSFSQLWGQLFFVQNYYLLRFGPTWTLAVEEHFYIFTAFFIALAAAGKQKIISTYWFPALAGLILIIVFWLRYTYPTQTFFHTTNAAFYSHNRFDSLMTGVILAWFWQFRTMQTIAFGRKTAPLLALMGLAGILLPYFVAQNNPMLQLAGRTFIYVMFTALLLFFISSQFIARLFSESRFKNIFLFFAGIGYYSYSIYLFHIVFLEWHAGYLFPGTEFSINTLPTVTIYFFGSILGGIAASKLIEQPILRLRENFAKSANPVQTES